MEISKSKGKKNKTKQKNSINNNVNSKFLQTLVTQLTNASEEYDRLYTGHFTTE